MRELRYIEVKVEPAYRAMPSGVEDRQLSVKVFFGGMVYQDTVIMMNSDAISVLDYCFERARRAVKDRIERDNPPDAIKEVAQNNP